MATKNAKIAKNKTTKPTISKPSNTVVKKVDKPRTAMAVLKKEENGIKSRDIGIWKPYEATRRYNRDNELKANREKQAAVQKVIDSRTKVNNKDLSKSLWSAVSNKWMKKSNIQWTVKLAEKTLSDAKQKLRTFEWSIHNWTLNQIEHQHSVLKKQVETAEKNLKNLNKTASKRK